MNEAELLGLARRGDELAFGELRDPRDHVFRLGAINLLALKAGRITWISGFLGPALQRRFDVPGVFPPRPINPWPPPSLLV
ncbi:MAG TPA: hypothetical protein VGD71_12075 [Kribbella sp.]